MGWELGKTWLAWQLRRGSGCVEHTESRPQGRVRDPRGELKATETKRGWWEMRKERCRMHGGCLTGS